MLASPFLTTWSARRAARRLASGTVATSSADVLWQANQHLIESLQAEGARKDGEIAKLIGQRDRLVGLMDEKIAPALAGIDEALKRDGALMAGNARMLAGLYARLEANGHEAAAHAP